MEIIDNAKKVGDILFNNEMSYLESLVKRSIDEMQTTISVSENMDTWNKAQRIIKTEIYMEKIQASIEKLRILAQQKELLDDIYNEYHKE